MASVCLSQANFAQQHHFQLMNNNIMLFQQQQQQQAQQQQYVNKPIAPAPSKVLGTSNLQNIQPSAGVGPMMNKKKFTYTNMPYGEQMPSVARRNARERNRVKQVNNGFSTLRQHLPQSVINALSDGGRGASKKLSKVDTLRIAVEYIRGLQDMLDDTDSSSSPLLLDECSNDGSNYAYSSMGSPVDSQYQLPYHSEASAASPTPSFSDSDISIGGANYLQPLKLEEPQYQPEQQQLQQPQQQQPQELQFKFEPFDNYGQLASDEQPDDEELLDYISSWQEQ